MKEYKFDDDDSWLIARKGKITGTRLKEIVVKKGTGKKIGYYELIAERLATLNAEPDGIERGLRLEGEALEKFSVHIGKKIDSTKRLWVHETNPNIALSPDGSIGKNEAVEVKCLSSARHLQAFLEAKVPDDYWFQVLQYFIVNEKLKKMYVVFYDPRISVKSLHYIEVLRKDVEDELKEFYEYQVNILKEVEEVVTRLSF